MSATAAAKRPNLQRDDRGSMLIEFGLAAPIITVLLVGVLEIGLALFTMTLMEAAVRDASRFGITGRTADGKTREQAILDIVAATTLGLVDMDNAQVDILVYPNFASIGAETYLDGNANGVYDVGETFTDKNGNGTWDGDIGNPSPGASGEVVLYRLRYDWPLFTPIIGSFIGNSDTIRLSASVAVRNEPWGTTP